MTGKCRLVAGDVPFVVVHVEGSADALKKKERKRGDKKKGTT